MNWRIGFSRLARVCWWLLVAMAVLTTASQFIEGLEEPRPVQVFNLTIDAPKVEYRIEAHALTEKRATEAAERFVRDHERAKAPSSKSQGKGPWTDYQAKSDPYAGFTLLSVSETLVVDRETPNFRMAFFKAGWALGIWLAVLAAFFAAYRAARWVLLGFLQKPE